MMALDDSQNALYFPPAPQGVEVASAAPAAGDDNMEQYIFNAAQQRGMDPHTAVAVARSEGLNSYVGDEGSSFGPFQLHYAGLSKSMPHSGLGDAFTQQTGLSAKDPSTWKQQVDFSLDYAKQHGWGSWMGAKNTGIGNWQGIRQPSGGDLSLQSAVDSSPKTTNAAASAGSDSSATGSAWTPPPAQQSSGAGSGFMNPQMKKMMALMWLKSSLDGVRLQRVDYDPYAVMGR